MASPVEVVLQASLQTLITHEVDGIIDRLLLSKSYYIVSIRAGIYALGQVDE